MEREHTVSMSVTNGAECICNPEILLGTVFGLWNMLELRAPRGTLLDLNAAWELFLSKKELLNDLKFEENYHHKHEVIDGIVYEDGDTTYTLIDLNGNKTNATFTIKANKGPVEHIDWKDGNLILYYTKTRPVNTNDISSGIELHYVYNELGGIETDESGNPLIYDYVKIPIIEIFDNDETHSLFPWFADEHNTVRLRSNIKDSDNGQLGRVAITSDSEVFIAKEPTLTDNVELVSIQSAYEQLKKDLGISPTFSPVSEHLSEDGKNHNFRINGSDILDKLKTINKDSLVDSINENLNRTEINTQLISGSKISNIDDWKLSLSFVDTITDNVSFTNNIPNILDVLNWIQKSEIGNLIGDLNFDSDTITEALNHLFKLINENRDKIGYKNELWISLNTDKSTLIEAINEVDLHENALALIIDVKEKWDAVNKQTYYENPNLNDITKNRVRIGEINKNNVQIVEAINELQSQIGNLDHSKSSIIGDLDTDNKDTLVKAINEVNLNADNNSDLIGAEYDKNIEGKKTGDITNLTTNNKSTLVEAINELDDRVGKLDDLETEDKSSIIAAINENKEKQPFEYDLNEGVVLKNNNNSSDEKSLVIGENNSAKGHSFVSGSNNTSNGKYSLISGKKNNASGNCSTTLGYGNTSKKPYSLVSGKDNKNDGTLNLVHGDTNVVVGDNNFVTGTLEEITGDNNIVVGNNNISKNSNNIILGDSNESNSQKTIEIGRNNLSNGEKNSVIGEGNEVEGESNYTLGENSSIAGNENYSIGKANVVRGGSNNINGNNNLVTGDNNTILGKNQSVEGNNNIIINSDSKDVSTSNSIVIGNIKKVYDDATNIAKDIYIETHDTESKLQNLISVNLNDWCKDNNSALLNGEKFLDTSHVVLALKTYLTKNYTDNAILRFKMLDDNENGYILVLGKSKRIYLNGTWYYSDNIENGWSRHEGTYLKVIRKDITTPQGNTISKYYLAFMDLHSTEAIVDTVGAQRSNTEDFKDIDLTHAYGAVEIDDFELALDLINRFNKKVDKTALIITKYHNLDGSIEDKSLNFVDPDNSSNSGNIILDLEESFGFNPNSYLLRGEKGEPNGYVPLNAGGLIDSKYLPSFVDDVIDVWAEYLVDSVTGAIIDIHLYELVSSVVPTTGQETVSKGSEILEGELGKIYIEANPSAERRFASQFRWSGSQFVAIGFTNITLGEVTGTAYDGGKGKVLRDEFDDHKNSGTTLIPVENSDGTTTWVTYKPNPHNVTPYLLDIVINDPNDPLNTEFSDTFTRDYNVGLALQTLFDRLNITEDLQSSAGTILGTAEELQKIEDLDDVANSPTIAGLLLDVYEKANSIETLETSSIHSIVSSNLKFYGES